MVNKSITGALAQKAGKEFEARMRESWRRVPGAWRLRISDLGGSERPGDEVILLDSVRILAEHKRISTPYISLTTHVKKHQINSGMLFSATNKLNKSLLFINFKDEIHDSLFVININEIPYIVTVLKKASITPGDLEKLIRDGLNVWKLALNISDHNVVYYDLTSLEERIIEWI